MARNMKKMIVLTVCSILAFSVISPKISAQESLEQEISQLENQLAQELSAANQKYQNIEKVSLEISELENQSNLVQQNIEYQQKRVDDRKESVKQRLQALQVSNYIYNRVIQLLQAKNLTDFFNRLRTIGDLFQADQITIQNYKREVDALEQSKQTLATQKAQLTQYQAELQTESTQYESAIQALRQFIRENQDKLVSIKEQFLETSLQETSTTSLVAQNTASETVGEETTITSQEVTLNERVTEENKQTIHTELREKINVEQVPTNTKEGKLFESVATAYSYTQPGLSFYTAMGIDLRENSHVIAVDPSVIPLGTLVEVPGYGVAIAGDTGGDIKGNRIDIHYKTIQEAMDFGRRNITIKILE